MNPFTMFRRSNLGTLWLLGWLSLGVWFGFGRQWQREHPATAHAAPANRSVEATTIKPEAVAKSPRIEAVAISEMRVGDQVPAENPTGEKDFEFGDTVDSATWRKITLLASKSDGSTADVELLRPIDWFDDLQATAGGTIELELAELGIEGPAKVLAIEPCPPVQHNRAFRIVTGTFKHHAGKIIELHLDGIDEPIGTTPNHPFWSVDRQAFVNASDLQPNEQLLGFDGLVRVLKLVELSDPEPVYNLEVQCDHVYHVAKDGVLVHNAYAETWLYQKIGPTGEHLKYGITKSPLTRYTTEELGGGRLKILASGSKQKMLELERNLHSTMPIGPEEGQAVYQGIQAALGLRLPPY